MSWSLLCVVCGLLSWDCGVKISLNFCQNPESPRTNRPWDPGRGQTWESGPSPDTPESAQLPLSSRKVQIHQALWDLRVQSLICLLKLFRMASLDLYTQNIPLTQKAKFWTNFVSSLKGRFSEEFSAHLSYLILLKRQPGSESCKRGSPEDLAPVCHRDSAQWLSRAQDRVHQARVPDVRQTHEARPRAPHPGHCWRQREVSRAESK